MLSNSYYNENHDEIEHLYMIIIHGDIKIFTLYMRLLHHMRGVIKLDKYRLNQLKIDPQIWHFIKTSTLLHLMDTCD